MTFSQYRDTYSWQGAIGLGPKLMRLAEELPASEEMGLSLHLRQLTVELPAGIAGDLLGERPASLSNALKMLATLELIDQIYPALDTAGIRSEADALAHRLASENFAETLTAAPNGSTPVAQPAPVKPANPDSVPLEPAAVVASELESLPPEIPAAAAAAAPTRIVAIAATPTLGLAQAPGEPPLAEAPLTEETDVHPDRV